jgi:hypothetical protein
LMPVNAGRTRLRAGFLFLPSKTPARETWTVAVGSMPGITSSYSPACRSAPEPCSGVVADVDAERDGVRSAVVLDLCLGQLEVELRERQRAVGLDIDRVGRDVDIAFQVEDLRDVEVDRAGKLGRVELDAEAERCEVD